MAMTLDVCGALDDSGRKCAMPRSECKRHRALATKERSFYAESVWALVEAAKKDVVLLDTFPEIAELRERGKEIDADYAAKNLTAYQKHKLKNEAAQLIFRGMLAREQTIHLRRGKLTHEQLRQIFRDVYAIVHRVVRDPVLRQQLGRGLQGLMRQSRNLPTGIEPAPKRLDGADAAAKRIEETVNGGITPPSDDTDG